MKKKTKKITRDTYSELIKRPETVVGAAVLTAVCVLVMMHTFFKPIFFKTYPAERQTTEQRIQPETVLLTPLQASVSADSARSATSAAVASPSATPAAIPTQAMKIKVKKDQTFWEIAKRYCGSHTFAESLAANNGYASVSKLREGDVITITCASR
jgi:hypothetical protein